MNNRDMFIDQLNQLRQTKLKAKYHNDTNHLTVNKTGNNSL